MELFAVVAIKRAKVTLFGGKSLTVSGYLEPNPQHTNVDALVNWKEEYKQSLNDVLNDLPTLTNSNAPTPTHDYKHIGFTEIGEVSKIIERFRATKQMPKDNIVKIKGKIVDVHGSMFFEKNNRINWALKLDICAIEDEDVWIKAVAFEKPSLVIMRGMTAQEASTMQMEKTDDFVALIEEIKTNGKVYAFCIYFKENEFNNVKKLDAVIEIIE